MNKMPMDSFSSYTDINGLRSISQKKGETGAGLEAAAKQFESIYLNMMLESMRKAERIWSEDNPFSNQTVHFYQDMLDNQLSVNLSQQRGVGLADMIIKQFGKYVDVDTKLKETPETNASVSLNASPSLNTNTNALPSMLIQSKEISETPPTTPPTTPPKITPAKLDIPQAGLQHSSEPLPDVFNTPEEFIKSILPEAIKAAEKLGVDPKVLVAQAALETGWGKHFVKTSSGENTHNLFGIKANKSWMGDVAWSKTHEYEKNTDQLEKTTAGFRVYQDYAQSFEDYVNLIKSSHRYSDVVAGEKNASSYLKNLQQSGYATDPNYAKKILSILDSGRFEVVQTGNEWIFQASR